MIGTLSITPLGATVLNPEVMHFMFEKLTLGAKLHRYIR